MVWSGGPFPRRLIGRAIELGHAADVSHEMGTLRRYERVDIERPRLATGLQVQDDVNEDWSPNPLDVFGKADIAFADAVVGEVRVRRSEVVVRFYPRSHSY